jgi:hypothetical protein
MTQQSSEELGALIARRGDAMTPREAVHAKYTDAVAKCVQPEATPSRRTGGGCTGRSTRAHEDAPTLGVSLDEDSAWREAADALA